MPQPYPPPKTTVIIHLADGQRTLAVWTGSHWWGTDRVWPNVVRWEPRPANYLGGPMTSVSGAPIPLSSDGSAQPPR